jgi:hypothetical protein
MTQLQGTLNSDTLRQSAQLNRPNQVSPFGSTTWTRKPTFDQDAYDRAMTDWHARGGHDEDMPNQSSFWNDEYTSNQDFDPRITDSIFSELGNQTDRSKLGQFMSSAVHGTITNPDGSYHQWNPDSYIPSGKDRVDPGQLQRSVDLSGLPDLKTADFSNAPGLPGIGNFSDERQRVEDAQYGRQTARLDPQYDKRQAALETQLQNQGFARGSEAWKSAMDDFTRERDDAYSAARNDAITGGGAEQSRLFGNALAARNTVTGEDLSLAQDARAARGQGSGEKFQTAGFANSATGQDLNDQIAQGNFMNAIRQQRFGEELTKRNQPFQEYGAFMGTGMPTVPGMGPVGQVGGVTPPDYMSAAMGAFNGQMSQYGIQQGGRNAALGGAAGIAGATASQWGPWLSALLAA